MPLQYSLDSFLSCLLLSSTHCSVALPHFRYLHGLVVFAKPLEQFFMQCAFDVTRRSIVLVFSLHGQLCDEAQKKLALQWFKLLCILCASLGNCVVQIRCFSLPVWVRGPLVLACSSVWAAHTLASYVIPCCGQLYFVLPVLYALAVQHRQLENLLVAKHRCISQPPWTPCTFPFPL